MVNKFGIIKLNAQIHIKIKSDYRTTSAMFIKHNHHYQNESLMPLQELSDKHPHRHKPTTPETHRDT